MNLPLLLRTIGHLRPIQIICQIRNRIVKPGFREYAIDRETAPCRYAPFIPKYRTRVSDAFVFLNRPSAFRSWDDTSNGLLWAYNLNYMDWLLQPGMPFEEGARWIERFAADLPGNRIGTDPYPIALRGINWIKFISVHRNRIPEATLHRWNDSLYSQYRLLCRKLEYHLAGNHLLEDAYSLFIASIYFSESRFYEKAGRLLERELNEQILPDGAHYEQSPMYHCILLDRLLDCYNFSVNNDRFPGQQQLTALLKEKGAAMTGHLANILYTDGTYPLFNDAATGIAPAPQDLFSYAERLGIAWHPQELKACGYRFLHNGSMESFIDIGNFAAPCQAGHAHADTFNYELRIKGRPFVIDTGISTYEKNARRQYERGTAAHNTVVVESRNSSEVWGGFRMGRRAAVQVLEETENRAVAEHNGYAPCRHRRTFEMSRETFRITDLLSVEKEGSSYLHLAPDIEITSLSDTRIVTSCAIIKIEGAKAVGVSSQEVSPAYNRFQTSQTIEIKFVSRMTYEITPL